MDPVLQFISLYSEVNNSFKLPYHSPAGRETLRPHFITMKKYEKAIFVWLLYQSLPHLSITYVMITVYFLSLQVLLLLGDTVLPTCFRGSPHHSAQQHLHETVREGVVFATCSSQLLPTLGSELSPLRTHLFFQKFEFCQNQRSGKAQDTLVCEFQGALTVSFPLTVYWPHFFISWISPKSSDYRLISHQQKQRERSKLCLYNSSQVQACKQTVSWSNLHQGKICKIPARATLLPRVTTRAWTPACKTPSVGKVTAQREKPKTCP